MAPQTTAEIPFPIVRTEYGTILSRIRRARALSGLVSSKYSGCHPERSEGSAFVLGLPLQLKKQQILRSDKKRRPSE